MVVVQKTSRQHYYLLTSPRHLTTYTEGRWSKYLQSPQRNRCSHNDALWKHESKTLLTWIRHRLLWHCCRFAARRYISPISVYHPPRLCASHIYRFNERQQLHAGKGKKQKITCTNYYGRGLHQWHSAGKYTHLSQILLNSMEQAAGGIGLHVNADKTENMCFNQRGNISTLNGGPLKLVDEFTYLGWSTSLTENDINMQLAKA